MQLKERLNQWKRSVRSCSEPFVKRKMKLALMQPKRFYAPAAAARLPSTEQITVVFGRCHLVEPGVIATTLLKQFALKYYPNEQLAGEEIARAGQAAQLFEIEIEHLSGKEVQER